MTRQTSRRRFLKAAAATGALAGVNATVLAQGQNEAVILLGGEVAGWQGYRLPGDATATESQNPTMDLESGTTYTLMWKNLDGVPHTFAIKDAQGNNLKVLEPLAVEQDVFTQINETSENQTVSLNISDGNVTGVTTDNQSGGNATGGQQTTTVQQVDVTQQLSEQGAVQGVRFTASEKMAQYICTIHPNTMVGDIKAQAGGVGGNNSSG